MSISPNLALFEELSKEYSLIRVRGKRPVEPKWERYCRQRRCFAAIGFKPDDNAGIACGPASGVIVLDIDDEQKFHAWLRGKPLPETRIHKTGRGGLHYLYQYPKDENRYINRSFKNFGFDIRADGGQVVSPGSVHPDTGEPYRIHKAGPLTPAPDWLLALSVENAQRVTEMPRAKVSSWDGKLESLPIKEETRRIIREGMPEGQRSEAIMRVVNALVWANLSDAEIFSIFEENPIGEKWTEDKHSKSKWLQKHIDKARSFVKNRAKDDPKKCFQQLPNRADDEPLCLEGAVLEDYQFISLSIPSKQTFLKPWLNEQAIALIVGWRGIGKTWFILLVLDAVTRGVQFGPWSCEASAPCLYLDGEMAASDVIERMAAIGTGNRKHPLYIYSDAYASQLGLPRASLLNPRWREGMKQILLSKGVKVWVIDNIASLTPGIDENSKQEWDPINQWLLDLRFCGITTTLLHHEGKEGKQRGTSAREDNIDISLVLQKPANYTPEDGARFITHFGKHRINTRDLPLIADTEFRIVQGANDLIAYEWGDVRRQKKEEILKLLDNGYGQKEITEMLQVDKGYVSRIKAQAMKDGILSKECKLTQQGFGAVYGNTHNGREFSQLRDNFETVNRTVNF